MAVRVPESWIWRSVMMGQQLDQSKKSLRYRLWRLNLLNVRNTDKRTENTSLGLQGFFNALPLVRNLWKGKVKLHTYWQSVTANMECSISAHQLLYELTHSFTETFHLLVMLCTSPHDDDPDLINRTVFWSFAFKFFRGFCKGKERFKQKLNWILSYSKCFSLPDFAREPAWIFGIWTFYPSLMT